MPLIALIWGIIGIILGWPYYWLSGSGEGHFIPCIVLVPVASVLGALLYAVESARRRRWTPSILFCIYLTWALSPIIMNGLSHFMAWQGWAETAQSTFDQRFMPLWGTLIGLFFLALIVNDLLNTHERMKKFHERMGNEAKDPPMRRE